MQTLTALVWIWDSRQWFASYSARVEEGWTPHLFPRFSSTTDYYAADHKKEQRGGEDNSKGASWRSSMTQVRERRGIKSVSEPQQQQHRFFSLSQSLASPFPPSLSSVTLTFTSGHVINSPTQHWPSLLTEGFLPVLWNIASGHLNFIHLCPRSECGPGAGQKGEEASVLPGYGLPQVRKLSNIWHLFPVPQHPALPGLPAGRSQSLPTASHSPLWSEADREHEQRIAKDTSGHLTFFLGDIQAR